MKITSLLLVLLASINSYAQEKKFLINVKLTGEIKYKYVYLYTFIDSSLKKMPFNEEKAMFKGSYLPIGEDGTLQPGLILISNDDNISEKEIAYNKTYMKRSFFVEPEIDILYNSDTKYFTVKGDSLNKIDKIFKDNEWKFKIKEDSLFSTLDAEYKDIQAKEKEIKRIKKANFLEEKKYSLELIKENINSIVAFQNFFIFTMVPLRPVEEIRAVYNSFPKGIRDGVKGLKADSLITVQENMFKVGLSVGDLIPSFELRDNKDNLIKSTTVLSTYTLIDFWASWCAPCRAETPNLISAFNKYNSKGFSIVAISIDLQKDKDKWLSAIEKDKSDIFINLYNPGGTSGIAKDLNINTIPANYLIDKTGKIIATNLRGEDLEKKLKDLLIVH